MNKVAIRHAAAGTGCQFWFDPALVHSGCCGRGSASVFVFFSYNLVPCRPFSVRFTSSANFSCLDRVQHADHTFHQVCDLTVPLLVCVFPFFSSLPFVGVVHSISESWGYKVWSSEDSSTYAASARVLADLVRQSTGNETSAFRVKPPAYRLTNLAPIWFFLSPVIRHYLLHFHPVFADFRFRATVRASVFRWHPFHAHEGKWRASFPFFFQYLRVVGHSACNFSPFRHYRRSSSR